MSRIERDSLGPVRLPEGALYGVQTQRAVENFPIGGGPMPSPFLRALGRIKKAAAQVAGLQGHLAMEVAQAIEEAAQEVVLGYWDAQFPVDRYQTGSGTSTNMNANEVIARRASELCGLDVHPNDQVNFGQSSNDVIPTAIHLSVLEQSAERLQPALAELCAQLDEAARKWGPVVKTARTHLMDALPVTFGQVFGGYGEQLRSRGRAFSASLESLYPLPLGGTAVGSGLNAPPGFAAEVARLLGEVLRRPLSEANDHFALAGNLDRPLEVMSQLKGLALALLKLCNDLRWMNSGPHAGLGEISLKPLQAGSSIMPGKINPVVEESAAMVCVQVVGYEAAVSLAASQSNFELNVMLPLVACNLLESIHLLAGAMENLARRSIAQLEPNRERIERQLAQNPILATALNPLVGYDKTVEIVKEAYRSGRSLMEVALEQTELSAEQLEKALDPLRLTGSKPG